MPKKRYQISQRSAPKRGKAPIEIPDLGLTRTQVAAINKVFSNLTLAVIQNWDVTPDGWSPVKG